MGSWHLVAVMVLVGCGYGALIQRMWAVRRDFEIMVRSPTLVCVSTLAGVVVMMFVLLQWRSRAEGGSLSCSTMAWVSPFASVFLATPYLGRAARLVVAYNQEYRYKFARYVKWKPLMALWIGVAVIVATETALVQNFRTPGSECFATDVFLMGSFMIVGGIPSLVLARTLRRVHDVFGIRQELERVLGIGMVYGGTNVILQVLVMFGVLPGSRRMHEFEEAVTFIFGAQVGIWSVVLPLASQHKLYRRIKSTISPHPCRPTGHTLAAAVGGVLDLAASGGDIALRFGKYCRENLCVENWEFILSVLVYRQMSDSIDGQHRAFVAILDQFIMSSSHSEVNIDSAMSNRVKGFRSRDAFNGLDDKGRWSILDGPLNEIVRLLEENLLQKFWQTELHRQDVELANVADGDKGLMDLMKYTDAGAEGGRRRSTLFASRKTSAESHGLPDGGCSIAPLPNGGLAAPDGEKIRTSLQQDSPPMGRSSNGSRSSTQNIEGGGVRQPKPDGLGPSSSSAGKLISPFGRRSSRRPILASIESADIALKDPELQR